MARLDDDPARKARAKVYNSKAHRTLKAQWAAVLTADGQVRCHDPAPGCRGVIYVGMRWDLAHDHADPSQYLGPAHARCNRWHAARLTNLRRAPREGRRRPRVSGGVFGPLSS